MPSLHHLDKRDATSAQAVLAGALVGIAVISCIAIGVYIYLRGVPACVRRGLPKAAAARSSRARPDSATDESINLSQSSPANCQRTQTSVRPARPVSAVFGRAMRDGPPSRMGTGPARLSTPKGPNNLRGWGPLLERPGESNDVAGSDDCSEDSGGNPRGHPLPLPPSSINPFGAPSSGVTPASVLKSSFDDVHRVLNDLSLRFGGGAVLEDTAEDSALSRDESATLVGSTRSGIGLIESARHVAIDDVEQQGRIAAPGEGRGEEDLSLSLERAPSARSWWTDSLQRSLSWRQQPASPVPSPQSPPPPAPSPTDTFGHPLARVISSASTDDDGPGDDNDDGSVHIHHAVHQSYPFLSIDPHPSGADSVSMGNRPPSSSSGSSVGRLVRLSIVPSDRSTPVLSAPTSATSSFREYVWSIQRAMSSGAFSRRSSTRSSPHSTSVAASRRASYRSTGQHRYLEIVDGPDASAVSASLPSSRMRENDDVTTTESDEPRSDICEALLSGRLSSNSDPRPLPRLTLVADAYSPPPPINSASTTSSSPSSLQEGRPIPRPSAAPATSLPIPNRILRPLPMPTSISTLPMLNASPPTGIPTAAYVRRLPHVPAS